MQVGDFGGWPAGARLLVLRPARGLGTTLLPDLCLELALQQCGPVQVESSDLGTEFRGRLIPPATRTMPAPGLVGSGNSLSLPHPQSCQAPDGGLSVPLTLPRNVQRPQSAAKHTVPFASFTGAGVPVPVVEREGHARSLCVLGLVSPKDSGLVSEFPSSI